MPRSSRLFAQYEAASPSLKEAIKRNSLPLESARDLTPLIDRIDTAPYVLIGEASHGTSEFYAWRALITRRLIEECGYSFIAVEGDWPDCYLVNRFVKGYPGAPKDAQHVLQAFHRWPTWMWANEEIARFLEWLKAYNAERPMERRVGFYGLDVYSFWESMEALANKLPDLPEDAAAAMRQVLRCFEPYADDAYDYARALRHIDKTCERDVLNLLQQVRAAAPFLAEPDDPEAAFYSEQNAFVIKNAEEYYRSMLQGRSESWNVRDIHMMDTLDRLVQHQGQRAKAIIWAHNTHVGDARFTDMNEEGEVNIGELTRTRHGAENVVLIGFGSYKGQVIAGRSWDARMELMTMPEAPANSWEAILHDVEPRDKMLIFEGLETEGEFLTPRGHRAVGVVYHPESERLGNYVPTVLSRRYDAFLFIDETRGLRPLGVHIAGSPELPETFPFGM